MAKDSVKPGKSPEIDLIDLAWDDDASGAIPILQAVPDVNEFDRVTAIPEEPSSDYVRHAMAHAEQEEKSGVQPIGERPATPGRMPEVEPGDGRADGASIV